MVNQAELVGVRAGEVEMVLAEGQVKGQALQVTEDGRGRYRIYVDGKASKPFGSVMRAGLAIDLIAHFGVAL